MGDMPTPTEVILQKMNQENPKRSSRVGTWARRGLAALGIATAVAGAGAVGIEPFATVDKTVVNTGQAAVGFADKAWNIQGENLDAHKNLPQANFAFSGNVDIPASIVNEYSEFGHSQVNPGNTDRFIVFQPAIDRVRREGGGFDDYLVIPDKDNKGNPGFTRIRIDLSSTNGRLDDISITESGTLVPIDHTTEKATMPNGAQIPSIDLGVARPDPIQTPS